MTAVVPGLHSIRPFHKQTSVPLKLPRPAVATACLAFLASAIHPQCSAAQAAAAAEPVVRELAALQASASGAFPIHDITLTRDAGIFTLTNGMAWPLTQVNGRVIGLVWTGAGRFDFTPPNASERQQLHSYLSTDVLETQIKKVVFLFADGTLDQMRGTTATTTFSPPSDVSDVLAKAVDVLTQEDDKTWDVSFLGPLLNGQDNGMFIAYIDREDGKDLQFRLDPDDIEGVTLSVAQHSTPGHHAAELIDEFARTDGTRPRPIGPSESRAVEVDQYTMDVRLPQSADGGVSFSATGHLALRVPAGTSGPWIPFGLYNELEVDSVRWDGAPVPYYKNHKSSVLWVRAPHALAEGEHPSIDLGYHGSLIDRYGDWFYLKESIAWYPVPMEGRAAAAFDITYHTPVGYPIASTGERTDSTLDGRMVTTHWVHPAPMRNASFNIGRFETADISVAGSPPITLLWSDAGHRELVRNLHLAIQGHIKETITGDVGSAMKFFGHVYGTPEEGRFYVTESPGDEGLAFPGMIDLSWVTFQQTDRRGADQVFRAHEVAHQWWGISVDYATYHDRWLSEGLAEFSGLWYMQTRRGNTDDYLDILRNYRSDILLHRNDMGATTLGGRVSRSDAPQLYQYAVYEKGAWTMHMLRTLLLQLSTMSEDRFTQAMQEFYSTHKGGRASTEDLRASMERASGANLRWFFDEWVNGTGVPTYDWAWKARTGTNGQPALQLRVRQSNVPDDFQMYVPIAVELKDGRTLRTRIHVAGPVTETQIPVPAEIKEVRFNDLEGVLAEVRAGSY